MFLELAEALDCPRCRSAFGLVAFVDEAEGRRVIEGRLGCPLCEIEFPIRGGTIDFDPGGADTVESGSDSSATDGGSTGPSSELAMRIAALLGLTDQSGRVVLLGPGLSIHAVELARMSERVEVLGWLESGREMPVLTHADLSAGVDPLRGVSIESWPIRGGSLHGIALEGPLAPYLEEAERCARPGGRFVGLNPDARDLERLSSGGFEEVASDAVTWVGERR